MPTFKKVADLSTIRIYTAYDEQFVYTIIKRTDSDTWNLRINNKHTDPQTGQPFPGARLIDEHFPTKRECEQHAKQYPD